jgi:Fic family protein
MKFPPVYRETDIIKQTLHELEILKKALELIHIPKETLLHIQRISLLKSSLYSARIEGNPLTLEDLQGLQASPKNRHKKEITNIERAFRLLDKKPLKTITPLFICKLHRVTMSGLSGTAGFFRTEESAIFNASGTAVYLAPSPQTIKPLLNDLCACVSGSHYPGPVQAGITHIWFEKIHPFDDGNGRVGRLLSSAILRKFGYVFEHIVPFEEYLDTHRQAYYDALLPDRQDVTQFIEFFLTALQSQAQTSLEELKNPPKIDYPGLLPRRQELLAIMKDHKMVSFDFLKRRFRRIPQRTLHNDLQQLMKQGLVQKLGTTRGVVYTLGSKASY